MSQASESISRVRDLTRECLQEARRSVWNLQTLEESIGLAEAIQAELGKTAEQGFMTSIDVDGQEPDEIDRGATLLSFVSPRKP